MLTTGLQSAPTTAPATVSDIHLLFKVVQLIQMAKWTTFGIDTHPSTYIFKLHLPDSSMNSLTSVCKAQGKGEIDTVVHLHFACLLFRFPMPLIKGIISLHLTWLKHTQQDTITLVGIQILSDILSSIKCP